MSKLDYITVRGFKSLADIEELELNNVNVLIGANGSGKSNFVDTWLTHLEQLNSVPEP